MKNQTKGKDQRRKIKFMFAGHLKRTILKTKETDNPCEHSQTCNIKCPVNRPCRVRRFHRRHPDWKNRQLALV